MGSAEDTMTEGTTSITTELLRVSTRRVLLRARSPQRPWR